MTILLDDLPQTVNALLVHVRETYESSTFDVVGPIPWDSALGVGIRLGWFGVHDFCVSECWPHHCPSPKTHLHKIRMTHRGDVAFKDITGGRSQNRG